MRPKLLSLELRAEIKEHLIRNSNVILTAKHFGKTVHAVYSIIKSHDDVRDWQRVRNYNMAYEYAHEIPVMDIAEKYHISPRQTYKILASTSLDEQYPLLEENKDLAFINGDSIEEINVNNIQDE